MTQIGSAFGAGHFIIVCGTHDEACCSTTGWVFVASGTARAPESGR